MEINLILPNGYILPLTVTLSIILIYLLVTSENKLCNCPEISKGVPNCLVAASSLLAILTFGER